MLGPAGGERARHPGRRAAHRRRRPHGRRRLVYVVDRKKDQIIAAGYKVWPREVEDVLYGIPRCARRRSSASPTRRGETVKAFVSLRPARRRGRRADRLLPRAMAAYKYPRRRVRRRAAAGRPGKVLRRVPRDRRQPRVNPEVSASIETADDAVQERLAEVLELRAADAAQQAILEDYLAACRGATARACSKVGPRDRGGGADPSPPVPAWARWRGSTRRRCSWHHAPAAGRREWPTSSYVVGSGTALPFEAAAFDAVIFHTVLSHIPDAGAALAEAARVTAAGRARWRSSTATTRPPPSRVGDHDPLQACADAAMAALVHDRYLVRRLGTLVRAAGWEVARLRSHGYVENEQPGYILTLIDRGADTLVAAGRLGAPARRRAEGRGAPAGGGRASSSATSPTRA